MPRSGSTLLMRLLNACHTSEGGGVTIRGEIMSLSGNYLNTYREMRQITNWGPSMTRQEVEDSEAFHPFFREAGISDAKESCRRLLRDWVKAPEGDVWGLKDVRSGVWEADLFNRTVSDLREIFPEALFLSNTRIIEDAAASALKTKWWGEDLSSIRKSMSNQTRNFQQAGFESQTKYERMLEHDLFLEDLAPLNLSISKLDHSRILNHRAK